ncbi:MAG: stage II sporulation protein M [Nitrososphaerota archaeon]|jgi:hypothetical protein|nr:stage II sporulation protein M [Nitrososphaerota archaeon]
MALGYYILSAILSFWKNATPLRKRIYSYVFVLILSIVITFAGTLVPLDTETANILSDQIGQTLLENNSFASLTIAIFVNNCRICLIMFIPIFGAAFGVFSLFSTGIAINALSIVQGASSSVMLLSLMIGPIFWIEFVAYSFGMTESIWLFRRLLQCRWRELKRTAMLIGIAVSLLAIGAIVESWLILYFPATADITTASVLSLFSLR